MRGQPGELSTERRELVAKLGLAVLHLQRSSLEPRQLGFCSRNLGSSLRRPRSKIDQRRIGGSLFDAQRFESFVLCKSDFSLARFASGEQIENRYAETIIG